MRAAVAAALLASLVTALPAAAQPAPAPSAAVRAPADMAPPSTAQLTREQRAQELEAAWEAAHAAATPGPASIPLLGQATLQVPAGMEFIPHDEAQRLSRAGGNTPGPDLLGFVNPLADSSLWLAAVRFEDSGHVSDAEADQLDAAALLASLREGTAESNKDRVERGFPEMELTGWSQPPAYDASTRLLTWALRYRMSGAAGEDSGLNYNTRVLGRDGYFSINLLSSPSRLEADRAEAAPLLAGLHYLDGKRYEDFSAGIDRVAAVGLAGLIGVVAAKKIGIIALAGAFLLKFAKVGVLAVLGLGVAAKRLFRRAPRT